MEKGTIVADRFTVERLVSAGGMGFVYRAIDSMTGDAVALKVVQRADAASSARFLREGRVLATLRHPRIVRYVAHGVSPSGEPYIVMEWLEGEDLAKRLRRGELSLQEALSVGLQACEGLAVAHAQGLVHRDLKPSNLFLAKGDARALKLIDFGVVRLNDESTDLTQTGMLLGTPGYMAPEQLRGSRDVDARADVFALGCVLYRCLAGVGPFASEDRVACLTRMLFEEPATLRSTRPELPEALEDLVLSMLRKRPEERPRDAAAVLRALHGVDLPPSHRASSPGSRRGALTSSEQRVVSLVLTAPLDRFRGAALAGPVAVSEVALRARVEATGARLEFLGGGAFAAISADRGSPSDRAAQAARAALAMRPCLAGAPIAVATGMGDTSTQTPVGEVIERAAALLHGPVPRARASDATLEVDAPPVTRDVGSPGTGSIYVDHVTAMLLAGRFDIHTDGDVRLLLGESKAREPVRTLLGRPTPCVGRERELSMLAAIFEECVAEPVASAVVVTAAAGVGKSRLRYEFLRQLEARAVPIEVWSGRGDPMTAGAPFGMLAEAIRGAAGLSEDDPRELRQEKLESLVLRHTPAEDAPRIIDFLGELVGVPFPDDRSPQLHAARKDPLLMGAQMKRAWEDFVVAECRAHPVVLVLEDLHWGDLPTVRLVDAVLRLRDQPLLVIAFARPEVADLFPKLWSERRVQPLPLADLSARSSERLVRRVLGEAVDPGVVARIVERAQGNAFHVEELIRAVVEGRGDALPETVLATTQARLEALDVEARRVLRAASVFGQSFSSGAVAALLGAEAKVPAQAPKVVQAAREIEARIDQLVDLEFLSRRHPSGGAGHAELAFRHAFVRDAAYATLTPADRALGHRLAARWLEALGEAEPLLLAQHFELGGEKERAVEWYARAAEGALEGNDFVATGERAARGRACGGTGARLGRLHALEMESLYWRGRLDEGARAGALALEALATGSEDYCRAIARLVTIHGRAGRAPEVEHLTEQLERVISQDLIRPEATRLAACALAESCSQLLYLGMSPRVERVAALAEEALGASTDPAVAAWLLEMRATLALSRGDLALGLELTEKVAAAFTAHGDVRQSCVEQSYVAFSYLDLGIDDESERHGRAALTLAERLGLSWVKDVLLHTLGYAVARLGRLEEGERIEREAVLGAARHGHKRLECDSRVFVAIIATRRGDLVTAEEVAKEAIAVAAPGSPWGVRALAALADVHLAAGRPADALAAATSAYRSLEGLGGSLDSLGGLVPVVYAEACHASGDHETATSVVQRACEALTLAAGKIRRPDWRKSYLENVPEHARLRALAEAWGVR